MGSATREALATSRAALAAHADWADLATGENLFDAGRVIGDSSQLLAALSDASAETSHKVALVRAVFGATLTPAALELLLSVAAGRWSSQQDLLAAIEELALRVTADSAEADVSIRSELFLFGAAVSSDAELELALTSKLGKSSAKVGLIQALLAGKVSPQTLVIIRHLVQQPRGRRIGELLTDAATIVADQADSIIATVTVAAALQPGQRDRLAATLSTRYGRNVALNEVVDASVVGGLKVQIGDDVIDGSVATRLKDLRLQLAG
ncbi:F0F1 ATP synthase subunit delta [Cryobacterium lactosi]|jgi:F-type H+-transporting ATPase subunit delta|uniref:ATP synthase subunit delta n=1 Tax=Cryobacterium lactosi TaxID=1259202 RepID=A0A4R9BJ83_9MICO|nr:F0F1 ATP synthase subunit delta [Cryobacterium lactosi]TFD85805.1 F0F1 ATP synthase subunit delta [Cryobacterium lactosi]